MSAPRSDRSTRTTGTLIERVYAMLLHLLPPTFRERFAEPMREHFRDQLRHVRETHHRRALIALCCRAIADLIATGITQWAVEHTTTREPSRQPKREMLHSIVDDLRYALRGFLKAPVFTAVAVTVIALGTGALSTIFSVANSVLLRPIPGVRDGGELAWIGRVGKSGDGSLSASYPYFEHLAANAKTMQGIAAWTAVDLTVRSGGDARIAFGNIVSGNYFTVVGARPFLGRFFSNEEGTTENTHAVVVVSHGYWRRELGADSAAVGKTILVNGRAYSVIGVAMPGFTGLYPLLRTDLWVPIMMHGHLRPRVGALRSTNAAWLELIGRRNAHVSTERVEAELNLLTARFALTERTTSPQFASVDHARIARWTGLPPGATSGIAGFFGILLVVAALVLAIASINVASMHLARAISRRREIALRMAIGASPGRVRRQLITESLLLFVVGGGVGVIVAVVGTRLLTQIDLPVDVPLQLDIAPDFRVLTFTLLVALVTGLTSGLAPAARSTRLDLISVLRSEGSGAGTTRSRLRNGLIVTQVAFSLVLLAAAGLFTRALDKGRSVDIGFDQNNVVIAPINVISAGYDDARARLFYSQLTERLRATPGIEAAGYTRVLPLSMSSMGMSVSMPDDGGPGRRGASINLSFAVVDEGYFDAIRLPIVQGRSFAADDRESAPRVAIVNQAFVRQFLDGRSPVGRTLDIEGSSATIVGVAKDSKYRDLSEPLVPFMYLHHAQSTPSGISLLVRSSRNRAEVAALIRREILALDRNLPPPAVTRMSQATAVSLLPQRAAAGVTGVLGALGLLLAAVGLYGLLAFSTAQRTREMGVRLAVGARPLDLLRMVVYEGMRLVALGSAIGVVLALALSRALVPFLFGLDPLDPLTFVSTIAMLGSVALLASYLPARRASLADPMSSLRQE